MDAALLRANIDADVYAGSQSPAEHEGHPDVSVVCVIGIPDDFSGELPLASAMPSPAAAARIKQDPVAVRVILMKVRLISISFSTVSAH